MWHWRACHAMCCGFRYGLRKHKAEINAWLEEVRALAWFACVCVCVCVCGMERMERKVLILGCGDTVLFCFAGQHGEA